MQPKNCQSAATVRLESTVCVAENNCQPNHSNGSSQSHLVPGQRNFFAKAIAAPANPSGRKIQFAQCVGQGSLKKSEAETGVGILASRMTGLPNFQRQRPRKSPNARA